MADDKRRKRQRILIVTGMNGAGKTTALKILEDLGYEAIDNLPLSLLGRFRSTDSGHPDHGPERALAIGVDSRTRAFRPQDFIREVADLKANPALDVALLFLECDDSSLLQRYSETRRRHPLAGDRPVLDGIKREREIMSEVKRAADFVYDTAGETVQGLRKRLKSRYSPDREQGMAITVLSFGFSRGLPRDADLVFDVRFLKNPHYEPELRDLTGRDQPVAGFIAHDENFGAFFDRLKDMIDFLLPLYAAEGKSYLTIALGCTGGRHRSVFTAELLGRYLSGRDYRINLVHRDADYGRPQDEL